MGILKSIAVVAAVIAMGQRASAQYSIQGGRIVLSSPFALEIGSTEYLAAFGALIQTSTYANYDPLTKTVSTNFHHHAEAYLSEPYFGCNRLSLAFDDPKKSLERCIFTLGRSGSKSGKGLSYAECRAKVDEIVADIQKRLSIVMCCTKDETEDVAKHNVKRLSKAHREENRKCIGFAVGFLSFYGERMGKFGFVDYHVTGMLSDKGDYSINFVYSAKNG